MLRRCDGRGLLGSSSGRGGRAVESGDVGGIKEEWPARSVNVSLKDVFVARAECGGRLRYPDALTVFEGKGGGRALSSVLPNSLILGLGVGGSAVLGTGR